LNKENARLSDQLRNATSNGNDANKRHNDAILADNRLLRQQLEDINLRAIHTTNVPTTSSISLVPSTSMLNAQDRSNDHTNDATKVSPYFSSLSSTTAATASELIRMKSELQMSHVQMAELRFEMDKLRAAKHQLEYLLGTCIH
jgi:hypothetical protein